MQGTRSSQPCKIFLFTQADAEECQAKKPCQRCDELELLRVDAGQWLRGGASLASGVDVEGSAQARTRRTNAVSGARAPDRQREAPTQPLPRIDVQ
ncbi:hypothetical protein CAL20_03730 [Bordetella genomosp. 4]|uniref:Uncharacterized protein n=1 Tax=Bordetella genomosp. 4 TaxID=463044 RepID=A0A261US92_9BORD|nr:hypothetical protein CAL20_03730 [Bordetella genomosp. 4]